MKRPKELTRIYSKPDAGVLQQSELFHNSFVDNKDLFVARFSQLADPFAAEWEVAIDNARDMAPDYEVVNQQTGETGILGGLMEQGRTLFQTLILYVGLAYPGDKTKLRMFGRPQYERARNSQLKLPALLRTAFKQASVPEYKAALMAKGMSEAEIARLDTLADEITEQDVTQETAITRRSAAANERIKAMNALWETMVVVSKCAKLLFQDDATRYNLFLLTDSVPEGEPEA